MAIPSALIRTRPDTWEGHGLQGIVPRHGPTMNTLFMVLLTRLWWRTLRHNKYAKQHISWVMGNRRIMTLFYCTTFVLSHNKWRTTIMMWRAVITVVASVDERTLFFVNIRELRSSLFDSELSVTSDWFILRLPNDFEIVSLLNEWVRFGWDEVIFDWWRDLENSQQTSMELMCALLLASDQSKRYPGARY